MGSKLEQSLDCPTSFASPAPETESPVFDLHSSATLRSPRGGKMKRGRYLSAVVVAAMLMLPGWAVAHTGSGLVLASPAPSASFGPASCPGAPIAPTHVITGQFDAGLQGS